MDFKLQIVCVSLLVTMSGYAQVQNNGTIRMHTGAAFGVFSDFTNNGTFTDNLGTLHVAGSSTQTFNGSNIIHANNVVINKPGNGLQLDNELQVAGTFTFTDGIVYSDEADNATEFVHFLDGSTVSGVSDISHVDGVVRKTGDEAFTFPVGDDNNYQPIGMEAPASVTDAFTAQYFEADPDASYNRILKESSIDHISSCEYWLLDRTIGSSDVDVTLSWDVNSCGINNLSDLIVAKWDGSEWKDHGNGGATGNTTAGSVITLSAVPIFSPFTLASRTGANPLPIELLDFDAVVVEGEVQLEWTTVSETNNDYFTIERSSDGKDWSAIENINGAGNSNHMINYTTVDLYPFIGNSFYRIKQTDFDEQFTYSKMRSVNINRLGIHRMTIYPNPTVDKITIEGNGKELSSIKIYNALGQEVINLTKAIDNGDIGVEIDLTGLDAGMYVIQTITSTNKIYKQ